MAVVATVVAVAEIAGVVLVVEAIVVPVAVDVLLAVRLSFSNLPGRFEP